VQVLAQAEDVVDVCAPGDGEVDPFCEWLLDATGNTLVARAAGLISTGLRVVVILVLAYVLSRLARAAIAGFSRTMERRIQARLDRGEARGTLDVERYRLRRFQRLAAITGVSRGVTGVLIWFVALLAVFDALGINLQPILAGAGLAGIVIGFGAQQLVRDVLAGIAMLIEDQFGVGDWIQIQDANGPVIGQVERVGLRATSFRDLDGVLWHTLNGSIERVGNLSQEWSRSTLDVPVALDADVPATKAIIHKVATELAADPVWGQDIIGAPEIWGVQDFGPHGLTIRLVMPTKPMANWDINRQLRERLHHAFEQAGIRMPTQLVDVGGQRRGYPLLSREDEDPTERTERRRRGLVPRDVGPLDRPPAVDLDRVTGDAYEDTRDRTAELRIERGREPRPD
jgi:moderate conductance mechanosensitive channel